MFKRFIISTVAAASVALLAAPAAHAAGPDKGEYDTAWTVTSATCSQIPEGTVLTGSGHGHFMANTRETGNGGAILRAVSHAQGTATDQDGNTYSWVYTNVVVGDIADGVVRARMVDSFVVGGSGPAAYATGFVAEFVEVPGVSFEIEPVQTHGDPFDFVNDSGRCDPI